MKFFLLTLIIGLLSCGYAKADDFDVLYQRLFDNYKSTDLEKTTAQIQADMDAQLVDGNWSTINYNSKSFVGGWEPLQHWDNLLDMAIAYKKTNHPLANDSILRDKIELGLTYWYDRTSNIKSDNWYDNDIAIQERLNKILILIKNDFSDTDDFTNVIVRGCDSLLVLPENYYYSQSKSKLTNAVWIARGLVHHGILEKDQTKLQQGIDNMSLQLSIQGSINSEGVQRDYSFLTHGLQLYNSGYGNGLINDVSYYMYLTRGLSIGFSSAQIATLSNLILKGDQWMIQGESYDFSVMGRNISRPDYGSTGFFRKVLPRMQLIDPTGYANYQQMLNHINDPTGMTSSILGNKHFFRADYMSHRRDNLFIGVKMCSERTRGTESLNKENLLGNWLPFGATTIMRTGLEYKNIFGVWDWSKIPGVTNPAVEIVWEETTNMSQSTTFVGGVSDGDIGVTAMDFIFDSSKDSVNIVARKANFLFNNEMICLGAGITSSYLDAPVTTTLNQSLLNGSVQINGTVVPQDDKTYNNVDWIYHDNTGYVFRNSTSVEMKNNSQIGNWYKINEAKTNEEISEDVFKLWIDHGVTPTDATYEYAVLPNFTSIETSVYAANIPVETIANTTSLQAVTHKTLQQTGAVFYDAGTVNINTSLRVTVDKPCILLIDWGSNPINITASDPNQDQTTLNVSINYSDLETETLVYTLPYINAKGASIKKTATISYPILTIKEFQNIHNSEKLQIYPNPSSGILNVKLNNLLSGGKITVLDSLGRILYLSNSSSSENEIILNNFKGIGVILVEKGNEKVVKKILIE